MPFASLLLLTFLAQNPSSATGQSDASAFPHLSPDAYPAAMREAVSRAERAARANPSDAAAAGALGRVLHAWEQWERAHAAYSRAAVLADGVFDWQYLDACVLQRLARHQEASARLRSAVGIAPDYLPARVRLAEVLLETGTYDESRSRFEALLAEPRAEPAARFGLGRIAAASGGHQQAVASLERAVALFPEWGAAQYALALSLRALGRRDDAQQALARHQQHGARWPALQDPVLAGVGALRDDAAAQLRRAEQLAEAGDIAAAAAENEAALARDPSLTVAHERLLVQYGRLGNWEQAERHYREAVRLGFNLADVHYDYGVLLSLQGKWELAADAYRRARDINPLHAQAHNNLGQILERTRQFDAALAEYRRAMESQPTFRLARFNAGRALVALGRPGEAVTELTKITDPPDAESPKYLFALAVAHLRAGNREEGIRRATEARELATKYEQADLATAIAKELERLQ